MRPGAKKMVSQMPQKITTGIKALGEQARNHIQELEVDAALKMHESGEGLIVDIRDIRELWREGRIPGAYHAPRGMLEFWIDPDSPYHKPVFNQDKTYVFYCASAWRSALSARIAMEMGLSPVMHMDLTMTNTVNQDGPVVQRDR